VPVLHTEALVLRVVPYGESDRIVHLLVPDSGRLAAIAKGARRSIRRFPGTLDLFNHLRVHLDVRRSPALARLDQAALIRCFPGLRAEAPRFGLGCYLLELLDRLAPEGAARSDARRLFAFALDALEAAASGPLDARLRLFLELRALDALGLRPELRRCVRCGEELEAAPRGGAERGAARPPGGASEARSEPQASEVPAARRIAGGARRRLADGRPAEPEARSEASEGPPGLAREIGFHVAEGGPACARCASGERGLLPVRLGTLRALERALRLGVPQLDRLVLGPRALDEARTLLTRFQRFHLGVELRSERVLDELFGSRPLRSAAPPSA
jgi:DNA repair protein RecO (recombination protein O)